MSENAGLTHAQQHTLWSSVTNRLAPALVAVFQVLALIVLLIATFNAFNYFRTPFIGSLVEHTLVINGTDSVNQGAWEAKRKGLGFGYQVLEIDNQKIVSVADLNKTLKTYAVGDVVGLTVINLQDPGSQPETVSITLQAFPVADQIAHMFVPLVIGLVYLGSGLWVFSLRRYDTTGQVFAIFTASVAVMAAGLFETGTTVQLTGFWTLCLALGGGALTHLSLLFPLEIKIVRKHPILGWLCYLPSLVLVVWALPTLFNFADPLAYVIPWRYAYIYLGLSVFIFVGMGVFQRFRAPSPVARQQSQILLLGPWDPFYRLPFGS